MKPSIERLRKAEREYSAARQIRYDELIADFSGDPTSDECLDAHKSAVARINLEVHAIKTSSIICVQTSAEAYICNDKLYVSDWKNHTREFKFDLS